MRNFLLLLLAGLAASCAPMAPQTTGVPTEVQQSQPVKKVDWQAAESAGQCSAIGGQWQPICMMQKPACVLTFKDAGKPCNDRSQCSGACVAEGNLKPDAPATGVCARTSDPCGCKQFVENGKAGYPLCAD